MIKYTVKDFGKFKVDEEGYKQCPTGDYSSIEKFESSCEFADGCVFGDGAHFGHDCAFGFNCLFGKFCYFERFCSFDGHSRFKCQCHFDDNCYFGNNCIFERNCHFLDNNVFNNFCYFGESCYFDKDPQFGICCRFGEKCNCIYGELDWVYVISGCGGSICMNGENIQFFGMMNGDIFVSNYNFKGSIQSYIKWLKKEIKNKSAFSEHAKTYLAQAKMIKKMVKVHKHE